MLQDIKVNLWSFMFYVCVHIYKAISAVPPYDLYNFYKKVFRIFWLFSSIFRMVSERQV